MKSINKIAALAVIATMSSQAFAQQMGTKDMTAAQVIALKHKSKMDNDVKATVEILSQLKGDLSKVAAELQTQEESDISGYFAKTNIGAGILSSLASLALIVTIKKGDIATLMVGMLASIVSTAITQVVALLDYVNSEKMDQAKLNELTTNAIASLQEAEAQMKSKKDKLVVNNLVAEIQSLKNDVIKEDKSQINKRRLQVSALAAIVLSYPVGQATRLRGTSRENAAVVSFAMLSVAGALTAISGFKGEDKELVISKINQAIESINSTEVLLGE